MNATILKKIGIILLILLISLISFAGFYARELNKMVNIIPDYKLGMDFGEIRAIRLDVGNHVDTKYYDEDGNEVESSEGENIVTKEIPENPEEVLNEENFEKSKSIIQERLNILGAEEYQIRQDENGYFAIEFAENKNTDNYIKAIFATGLLEIKDTETKEVLMNNDSLKDSYASIYSAQSNKGQVYLVLEFNEDGRQKLEEISKEYIETTDEEGKTTKKTITITIDGQTIISTYFGQTLTAGILQVPIGEESNSNDTLNEYLKESQIISSILKSGKMPIVYELAYDETFSSTIRDDVKQILSVIAAVIVGLSIAFLCIRFFKKGIFGGIAFVGYIATYLLIVRYTNSFVTVNSIIAIIIACVYNYIFIVNILRNKSSETFNENYTKYAISGIPMYVISIIFAFSKMTVVSSFGTALFWGSILMLAYNYVITKSLLEDK